MMVRKAMAVLQPSPRDSPWKALSKEDLEKQYSPSRWSHRLNAEEVIKAHVRVGTEATKEAQASKQSLLGVAYGEGDGEKLDIYFPAKTSEGNVDLMLSQVKHSVLFIQKQYSLNRGIYLCGHSAGAHLASMVLLTDWVEHEVIPNIKGFFLVSGIYDLEPIVHTYVNDILQMTLEDAQRNSPMFCQKEAQSQVTSTYELIVAVGQHDSPEFLRQSLDYFQTLRLHGWRASFIEISNVDHFDIIEKLIQKEYILTQVILKTIFQ
ncbi:kynurenine formamidase isoform X3 [Petaurus breviceps papuanus]|uniref:kynurenine formamidase isoform X3 n=1 Tax=Petaurus breviceps papuanus TaxID=3040969 RepID=UPI0036DCE3AB